VAKRALIIYICMSCRVLALSLLVGACSPFVYGQSIPIIDTTPAWTGVAISGPDAVGQVITAPTSNAQLTAFEFFNTLPATPFTGGIFLWDDVNGTVIGVPLAVTTGIPPENPSNPFFPTVPGTRVRFVLAAPLALMPSQKYLLYAYSLPPHETVTSWLLTSDSYPYGLAKWIFPPNGTVIGPWSTVTALSPGPDAWAIRVLFLSPATNVPTLSGWGVALLSALLAVVALTLSGRPLFHQHRRK
jgi:hypothetical protein